MIRRILPALAALLLVGAAVPAAEARGGHGHSRCYACSHRSSGARYQFKKMTGYSHGRPGYVIDHIVPLKRGGADSPSNMQWQTKDAAAAKDKWE